MANFISQLSQNKGSHIKPTHKQLLDQQILMTAEYIKNYIIEYIAPYTKKNEPICADFCLNPVYPNEYINQHDAEPELRDGVGHLMKSVQEYSLNEDAIYFRNELNKILSKDKIHVSNWQFVRLFNKSSDDYGENFSVPANSNMRVYTSPYFTPATTPINPLMSYYRKYTCFFGIKKDVCIQGHYTVNPKDIESVGLIIHFREY